MSEVLTPDWVKDAVFYQIFPDRFAKSDRVPKAAYLQPWDSPPSSEGYKGGDLLGVVEHLDHLSDLGVTAIYFCPIFQSGSNHRYHTHDYFQVDPMLGGNAALRTLLDAAHDRGMRVVLDGVFNHASRGFFQFHDILENGSHSAYLDWFTVLDWPLRPYSEEAPNYACWFDLPALPKFRTETPAVREFIWDVATYWIDFGIDGWRLDVPSEIDDDGFWQEFRRRVKARNPEAYIVGEIWQDAQRWLQGDQFDAVMNYGVSRATLTYFGRSHYNTAYRPGGFELVPHDAVSFADEIDRLLALYPEPIVQVQLNLLDSHDTARFLHQANGEESTLRLALLFLMTTPGAPCIYYGTEVGMTGGHDPECRGAFPWESGGWNMDLLAFTRRAIALRHAHPALRRGRFQRLYARGDVYAFARQLADETLIVLFNAGIEPEQVSFEVGDLCADGPLSDVWGNAQARVTEGVLEIALLPPRAGAVLGSVKREA